MLHRREHKWWITLFKLSAKLVSNLKNKHFNTYSIFSLHRQLCSFGAQPEARDAYQFL